MQDFAFLYASSCESISLVLLLNLLTNILKLNMCYTQDIKLLLVVHKTVGNSSENLDLYSRKISSGSKERDLGIVQIFAI